MKELKWSELKNYIDSRKINIQYIDKSNEYFILVVDDSLQFYTILSKNPTDTTDLDDFESNYKPNANLNLPSKEVSGVKDPKGMRARLIGTHNSTITAGQTQNIDWKIPNLSWNGSSKQSYFDGIEYYAQSSEIGDYVKFQVIDIDGITYPAGTVLEEFADNYYVFPNHKDTIRLYKAKLIPDMYIRVVYTSIGNNNVKFLCNILRHLDQNKNL